MTSRNLSDRIAVLEVMVELLASQSMLREADPDKALADYGEVAVMMLSARHSDDEMDSLIPALVDRTANVQEHIHMIRELQRRESMQ